MKLILLPLLVLMYIFPLGAQPKLIQENHYKFNPALEEIKDKVFTYQYDEQGRLIHKIGKRWVENEGWFDLLEHQFEFNENGDTLLASWIEINPINSHRSEKDDTYSYDDNDFLLSHHTKTIFFDNDQNSVLADYEIRYQNYCDGLAKEAVREQFDSFFEDHEIDQIEYIYDQGLNCDSPSEEVEILVYPNPNNGIFYIESDLFIFTPIPFIVFDNLGRQVLKGELQNRASTQSLDLSRLDNGSYYLRLFHESKFINKKLIIHKN